MEVVLLWILVPLVWKQAIFYKAESYEGCTFQFNCPYLHTCSKLQGKYRCVPLGDTTPEN